MRYRTTTTAFTLAVASTVALSGCSSDSGSTSASSGSSVTTSSSSSEVTVSGVPDSSWSRSAPSTTTPHTSTSVPPQSGGVPTAVPKAADTATTFVTDFLHTDGVSQEAWAKKVKANASTAFGGRLASQGLERLPHGVKVTGKAQQVWISDQEPTGTWYVPTSNGGYTATMDLTTPSGKVTDLTPGKDTSNNEPLDTD